ncbi:MAG: hypothetical protein ABI698_01695 [bacterium]
MSKLAEAKPTSRLLSWAALSLMAMLLLGATARSASAQSTDQDSPTPFTANEIKGTGTDDKTEYFYAFSADPGDVTLTFDVKADKNASLSGFDYEVLNAKGKRLAGGFLDPVRGESKRAIATVSVKGPGTQSLLLKLTVTEYVATYRVRLGGSVVVAGADSATAITAGGGAVSAAPMPQATPDPTAAQPAAVATPADSTVVAPPDGTAAQPAADATAPTEAQANASAAQAVADAAKPGKKINLDFNLKDKLNLLKDIPTSGSMVILMKDGTTQEIQMKNVKSITMKP